MTMPPSDVETSQKIVRALDGFCEVFSKERPLPLLLLGSFLAGCAFCLALFDFGFLAGTSHFWSNPRGILPNSWADISTALSGYLYFQRDTWHLPLFHVDKLGSPTGVNIIFTDGIPWVSLAGRIVFRASSAPVNLFGIWTAFCFVASAMTLTALVAAFGQRGLAAAAMATVTGLCMPALLARWGHMSMIAQFEIPLAIVFYLRNYRSGKPWRLFQQAAALMWLALWTFPYIFVMVAAIALATIAQAMSNHSLKNTSAVAVLTGLAIMLSGIITLSGHLQSQGALSDTGVGIYSMNLLSPFLPQRSGLFTSLRNVIADGTGGQYEGFSYLGTGVLMLLLMTLPWQVGNLRESWRHHPWLIGLFLCFTLFALSNIIYLGTLRLIHIPLPEMALQLAAMFRSTGRFFWPVMYSMAALAIAAPIFFYGRYGVLLLFLAVPLQWIDTAPLRQAMVSSTRVPEKPHIDLAIWEAAIRRHDSVRVLPQYSCMGRSTTWSHEIAVQLQLLAAFANRPINSVYAARFTADCPAEQQADGTPQPGSRQLSVFVGRGSSVAHMRDFAETSNMCRAGNGIVVCSDIPEEGAALAALAKTDRK